MQILKRHARCLSTAFLAGFIFLDVSCAVRLPVTEQERQAAQTLTAPKGKAVLFVYRPSTILAMVAPRPVFINRKHLVSTTNGTFVAIPLKPGTYRIQAAAQALIDSNEQRDAYPEIVLTAREGKTYFIRQSVGASVSACGGSVMQLQTGGSPIPVMLGNDLPPFKASLVDESIGQSECSNLKLIGADSAS